MTDRVTEQMFDNCWVEAEAPAYVSPLLELLNAAQAKEPKVIEIPKPTPELQQRIDQLNEHRDRVVNARVDRARDRAFSNDPHAIAPPLLDKDLAPEQLSALNELRAEWAAWHADPANADWRPDGGPLDVTHLVAGIAYRREET